MGNPGGSAAASDAIDEAERSLELLPWDSAIFGFGVGRIRDTVRTTNGLAAALRALAAQNIRLAYYACPGDDRVAQAAATTQGARLVDRKVTYAAACSNITIGESSPGVSVARYTAPEPDEGLIRLARQSGEYSRFRTDPSVDRRVFERIYDAWIRNSVRGDIADEVFVARLDGFVAGLVTVAERGSRGDIGLLAVDDRARRRGVGRALVGAARDWTLARRLDTAQVVTQGENAAACALYEACGYHAESVAAVYHFWL